MKRQVIAACFALGLLCAASHGEACSVALKRGETTEDFRARHLKRATVIVGTLSALETASERPATKADVLVGPETAGTVTGSDGRTFSVTFIPAGPWVFNSSVCGVFNLPTAVGVKGTFYLVREHPAYRLLHFVAKPEAAE